MNQDAGKETVLNAAGEVRPKRKKSDWVAKVLCLLAAFIIWFYVMQVDSPDHEETFSVDVTLTNTAAMETVSGLSIYNGYGTTVDVTVTGKKSVIGKLTSEDFRVTADVSSIDVAGFHAVPVNVELPAGLTLSSVSQNTVQIYADEKSSKVVDIRAKIESFVSQYEVGEPRPAIETVTVTGPKSALDEIEYAQISLTLGNINASMNASGALVLIDKNGGVLNNPYLRLSRKDVLVNIPVYTTKTLPVTVNYKYGYFNDTNVRVTINPQKLALRGDPAVLNAMSELVATTLDEKRITGDVTQLVALALPEGMTVHNGAASVLVTVQHLNTRTASFTVTNIEVTGAQDLDYELATDALEVTVRGTPQQLAQLKNADFAAVIDLSGYAATSSGEVTTPATILIDSEVAEGVYEIGDYGMKVKLN